MNGYEMMERPLRRFLALLKNECFRGGAQSPKITRQSTLRSHAGVIWREVRK